MKIKKQDWYGFDHEAINNKLSGDLIFCNYFCVKGEYNPVAVYKAANPDESKGHKKYVLIHKTPEGTGVIRGMTTQEMKKERYQDAVICPSCDTLLYSVNRHNFHKCGCPNDVFVDGGKDYLRSGYMKNKPKTVTFDLITNKVVKKK